MALQYSLYFQRPGRRVLHAQRPVLRTQPPSHAGHWRCSLRVRGETTSESTKSVSRVFPRFRNGRLFNVPPQFVFQLYGRTFHHPHSWNLGRTLLRGSVQNFNFHHQLKTVTAGRNWHWGRRQGFEAGRPQEVSQAHSDGSDPVRRKQKVPYQIKTYRVAHLVVEHRLLRSHSSPTLFRHSIHFFYMVNHHLMDLGWAWLTLLSLFCQTLTCPSRIRQSGIAKISQPN